MTKELEIKIKEEGNEEEFEYIGLKCLIIRHPRALHWYGYVRAPIGTVLESKQTSYYYTNGEAEITDFEKAVNNLEVHGGITYVGKRKDDGDVYWGFDLAHAGDLSPGIEEYSSDLGEVYRDKEYAIEECKNLVRQIKEITELYSQSK